VELQIEELFSCEPSPAAPVSQKAESDLASSVASSATAPPHKPPDQVNSDGRCLLLSCRRRLRSVQVYLVDQKTSLKISLFLKQFRSLSLEQVVASVVSEATAADEQLPLEKLRGLQCCLVGVEPYVSVWRSRGAILNSCAVQIADVRAYEGDLTKLGLAEKFLWLVGQHRFFATQLEVKCLQKEFDDKVL